MLDDTNALKNTVDYLLASAEELMQNGQSDLEKSEEEVLKLHPLSKLNEWADSLDFDDLTHLTFVRALEVIKQLTLKRRIELLADMQTHLDHCYAQTKRYDVGITKEEQISSKVFMELMGRIKHLEILRSWLFGIE